LTLTDRKEVGIIYGHLLQGRCFSIWVGLGRNVIFKRTVDFMNCQIVLCALAFCFSVLFPKEYLGNV